MSPPCCHQAARETLARAAALATAKLPEAFDFPPHEARFVRVNIHKTSGSSQPGIDELDGETREALATEVARRADILIMVCEGDLTRREFAALQTLAARQRPVLLVLNKADRYNRMTSRLRAIRQALFS